jgi:hypothetical protein
VNYSPTNTTAWNANMFSLTHNIALNKSPSSLFTTASAATSSQSSAAQLQVCKGGATNERSANFRFCSKLSCSCWKLKRNSLSNTWHNVQNKGPPPTFHGTPVLDYFFELFPNN